MVCIREIVLEKGADYSKWCRPRKPVSRMSDKEILDYLAVTKIPMTMASPWPREKGKKGLEFISGYEDDLVYDGITNISEETMRRHASRGWESRVYIDTYFNRVAIAAYKRGLISLHLDTIKVRDAFGEGELLGGIFADIFALTMKRDLELSRRPKEYFAREESGESSGAVYGTSAA